MAWSVSMLATRLSEARSSRDMELAKYKVRATSPNATQSTMINTEPARRAAAVRQLHLQVIPAFMVDLRCSGPLDWWPPARRRAPPIQPGRAAPRRAWLARQRVEAAP